MNPLLSRLVRLAFGRGGFASNVETYLGLAAGVGLLYAMEAWLQFVLSQTVEGAILLGTVTLSNQLLGNLSWVRAIDARLQKDQT